MPTMTQGRAEDLVMRFRYCYYVNHCAIVTDEVYDKFEAFVRAQWSVCICGIGGSVGSDDASDYPHYIAWGIWPTQQERLIRDATIAQRWMENL